MRRNQPFNNYLADIHLPILLAILLLLIIGANNAFACNLQIYTASSLTDVMNEIIADYNSHGPFEDDAKSEACGIYAGSSALARQIEHGAPAKIFISANAIWMDYLVEKGLIKSASHQTFAQNVLVIATHRKSDLQTLNLQNTSQAIDTLSPLKIGIGEINSVPVGIYGAEALRHFQLFDALNANLVYGDNVRSIVNWLLRREIDAGIVYRTDVIGHPVLAEIATFPAESHSPIVYNAAMVGENPDPFTKSFYEMLLSPPVQGLLQSKGFVGANGTSSKQTTDSTEE